MLYSEIIAVCPQTHTKQINTLCGQKVKSVCFQTANTCSRKRLSVIQLNVVDVSLFVLVVQVSKFGPKSVTLSEVFFFCLSLIKRIPGQALQIKRGKFSSMSSLI
jgi:hypothetical protein